MGLKPLYIACPECRMHDGAHWYWCKTGKLEYPECSGNPAACPENEGRGCCQPNPSRDSPQPRVSDSGPHTSAPHESDNPESVDEE